jgi:hypothetical protein
VKITPKLVSTKAMLMLMAIDEGVFRASTLLDQICVCSLSDALLKLTFLQPIEPRGNRRLGVVLLRREDVSEEGVFVCDQGRLESLLGVLVVLEGDWSGHVAHSLVFGLVRILVRVWVNGFPKVDFRR